MMAQRTPTRFERCPWAWPPRSVGPSAEAIAYYGISMAESVVPIVPALLIFILLQRYLVKGIALTGLQG